MQKSHGQFKLQLENTMNLFIYFLFLYSGVATSANCESPENTIEINECAAIQQDRVEKELNIVYSRVFNSITKESEEGVDGKSDLKKRFIEAQRNWIKFRETDCDAIYLHWYPGSIRGIRSINCMRSRAEQRIKELMEYEELY